MDAKAAEILEQPEKIQNCQIKTVGRKQLQTPFLSMATIVIQTFT